MHKHIVITRFFCSMPPKSSNSSSSVIPIVIVERNGDVRESHIDAYSPLELSKKCKFKTTSGFEIRAEWAYSGMTDDDDRFIVELWAREDGNAGQENKYEFPPPVDTILFFGACALVAKDMSAHHHVIPLTLEKWDKMYNFLFGGFDTLTNYEDDEDDELDSTPSHRKTKDGYLKDGFVVDNSRYDDDDDDDADESDDTEDEASDDEDESDDSESEDEYADSNENDDEIAIGAESKRASTVKGKAVAKRREKKQPKEEFLVDTSSE